MKSSDILTLLRIPGAGRVTVLRIINGLRGNEIGGYERLLHILQIEQRKNPRIKIPTRGEYLDLTASSTRLLNSHVINNIKYLNITEDAFPERLKLIPNPPLIIYYVGNIRALNSDRSVAIIGTREPTDFGIRAGYKLASIFANHDFTIVSGLAIGCDTVGHRGCLEVGGQTVAVLPSGLEKVYPKQNMALAEQILDFGGCLMSEYPIGTRPMRNNFIERDRLQSGLSQGVIVIETDVKGGTMHTVKFAEGQRRPLACLWGHPSVYMHSQKINGNRFLLDSNRAYQLSSPEEIQFFMNHIINEDNKVRNTDFFGNNEIDFKW